MAARAAWHQSPATDPATATWLPASALTREFMIGAEQLRRHSERGQLQRREVVGGYEYLVSRVAELAPRRGSGACLAVLGGRL